MSEKVLKNLAGKHHLDVDQIQELLQLLDAGYSAPYILRYRKDLAANLDYEVLDELRREARRLNRLDKERQKIREKLQDQGVLTGDLEKDIESASSMSELIDYYVPFRPRKRSRSRLALSQGLEALALKIFHQEDPIPLLSDEAESYADEAQGLEEVGEVLDGTFHIICDWIAEEKSHRDKQRRVLREKGKVVSEGTGRSKKRYRSELRDYMKFESPVKDVHPYHILCMMRGKRLKVLDYRVEAPMEEVFQTAADLYLRGGREQFSQIETRFYDVDEKPDGKALGELNAAEFLYWCIRVSLSNVLIPILNRELEKELRAEAEKLGLDIIKSNLRSHLMRRPLKGARVLGISPGYRTGCKLAAVDENGGVLESAVVYPNTPRDEKEKAKEKIVELVQGHDLSVVSIGDGTACDETEKLLSEIIEESFDDLQYCVLDERPSDAYAGSSLAKRECGSRKKGIQSAISLARRLLDPLRELCKVNLKDLCPSRYVQEVDNIALKETIRSVAEESVGQVGPQLNEAPRGMLKYVPGLHGRAANEIVKYRNDNGPFDTRWRLREVPKTDKETWERAAGFVRIKDSDNPLDNTRIHPQMYPVAEKIVAELDCKLEDLKNEETLEKIREKRGEIKFADLEKEFDVHYLVLKDILDELCDPWPDPRQNEEGPVLRQKPLRFQNLEPLQVLRGTVRKVVDFGAFVDVGVSEDGLVHVSELADEYVESPYDVVWVGSKIKVRVVEVDPDKRRIALSMRSEDAVRKASERKRKAESKKEQKKERRKQKQKSKIPTEVPDVELPSSVQKPKSTVGKKSRRMERLAKFDKESEGQNAMAQNSEEGQEGRQKKGENKGEKADVGDLLDKLDFAAIEKRGEQKE